MDQARYQKAGKTDRLLKRFRYKEALDLVLTEKTPPKVVSLFIELARRDALKIALSNRDVESLAPIMMFLVR